MYRNKRTKLYFSPLVLLRVRGILNSFLLTFVCGLVLGVIINVFLFVPSFGSPFASSSLFFFTYTFFFLLRQI